MDLLYIIFYWRILYDRENPALFTISEMAKSCGVSRATLLRMEKSGFLTPYRIDEESGYRYYDVYNVSQIRQYQLLQHFGLSQSEIADFYYERIDQDAFIREQEKKISQMTRCLEELKLRRSKDRNMTFSFFDMPDYTCYTDTTQIDSIADGLTFAYNAGYDCITKHYTTIRDVPIFTIREGTEKLHRDEKPAPWQVTICYPVYDGQGANDPHIKTIPGGHFFSILLYGNHSVMSNGFVSLWEELNRRNLKAAGPARNIAIVAPVTGKHINPDNYVYRLAIPIEME